MRHFDDSICCVRHGRNNEDPIGLSANFLCSNSTRKFRKQLNKIHYKFTIKYGLYVISDIIVLANLYFNIPIIDLSFYV